MLVSRKGFKAGATKTCQRLLKAALAGAGTPTASFVFPASALSLQTRLGSPLHVIQLSCGRPPLEMHLKLHLPSGFIVLLILELF